MHAANSPNALVEVWDGWRDIDQGIYPPCVRDPVIALAEVADARGPVMHSITVCPATMGAEPAPPGPEAA